MVHIPPQLNPWAPLDVMAQPGLLTRYKLSRARNDPARCLAALATTGMQYDTLPDRSTGEGCGFQNAVRLRTAAIRIGAPLPLSCPMALVFFMWERHALQPAAQVAHGPACGRDRPPGQLCLPQREPRRRRAAQCTGPRAQPPRHGQCAGHFSLHAGRWKAHHGAERLA
jgi:hypothetical protein